MLKIIMIQRGNFFSSKKELTGEKRINRNEAITNGSKMFCNSERRIPEATSPIITIKKVTVEFGSNFSFIDATAKWYCKSI